MIYEYICPKCNLESEVIKPHQLSGSLEFCIVCNGKLKRIYSVPQVHVKNHGYYNYGIDKYVSNKNDIKDAKKAYHDKTGSELIEVGNERPKAKRKTGKYDLSTSEVRKAIEIIGANK